jgi:transcription elongation factor GreA
VAHHTDTHDVDAYPRASIEEFRMIWLTRQTFDRLNAELEERRGPVRAEIVERISSARDEGDLKENGGYHAAKDEQGTNEGRIRQLEEMLSGATTQPADDDQTVSAGKLVTYRYDGDDDEESFLLGAREIAEDHTDIEVYSPESPLGTALLGHKAGETVDFEQPNGRTAKIEIISAVPFAG